MAGMQLTIICLCRLSVWDLRHQTFTERKIIKVQNFLTERKPTFSFPRNQEFLDEKFVLY